MEELLIVAYGVLEDLPAIRNSDTLYFVTDTRKIYRGDVDFTGNIDNITISEDSTTSNGKRSLTITFKDGSSALSVNLLNSIAIDNIISVLDGQGNATTKGLVKLSDAIDSQSNANQGVAATPKAVNDALEEAKNYADGLLAANDAMQFKGTLGTGGTVTSLPTNNYSAGWTYKVITAGTYAGFVCEVGDLIIAVKDGPTSGTSVINSDWTVAQANIDGAVTAAANLDLDQLVVGGGNNKTVKKLPAGQAGQVVTMVNGKPQWANLPVTEDNDTTYTFANGTDGSFTVTPKDGSAQKVTIGKPATAGTADKVANSLSLSISSANRIGTTAKTFNGSSAISVGFGAAAAKDVSESVENSENVILAKAVYNALRWRSFTEL